jgi:hypothetical protein
MLDHHESRLDRVAEVLATLEAKSFLSAQESVMRFRLRHLIATSAAEPA